MLPNQETPVTGFPVILTHYICPRDTVCGIQSRSSVLFGHTALQSILLCQGCESAFMSNISSHMIGNRPNMKVIADFCSGRFLSYKRVTTCLLNKAGQLTGNRLGSRHRLIIYKYSSLKRFGLLRKLCLCEMVRYESSLVTKRLHFLTC